MASCRACVLTPYGHPRVACLGNVGSVAGQRASCAVRCVTVDVRSRASARNGGTRRGWQNREGAPGRWDAAVVWLDLRLGDVAGAMQEGARVRDSSSESDEHSENDDTHDDDSDDPTLVHGSNFSVTEVCRRCRRPVRASLPSG